MGGSPVSMEDRDSELFYSTRDLGDCREEPQPASSSVRESSWVGPCNWRDCGEICGLQPHMFYRSSEVHSVQDLVAIKCVVDLRRPKDVDQQLLQGGQIEIPEHCTRHLVNLVPTNPTGLAIFRAIPTGH